MPQNRELFDARHAASSLIGPFGVVALLVVAALVVRSMIKPNASRGGDPTVNAAVKVLMLVGVAAVLAASSLTLIFGLEAKVAIASGKVSFWQGCVRSFDRQVHHEDHNLTDTYLSVGGKPFHFNSSPWLPGFHNERDEIRPDEWLRITTSGDTVLRIEQLPRACPRV